MILNDSEQRLAMVGEESDRVTVTTGSDMISHHPSVSRRSDVQDIFHHFVQERFWCVVRISQLCREEYIFSWQVTAQMGNCDYHGEARAFSRPVKKVPFNHLEGGLAAPLGYNWQMGLQRRNKW